MSLFRDATELDRSFLESFRKLANSAESISKSLEIVQEQKELSDKQVKEIISSYPPEDLYNLLNYDQRRTIWLEEMESDLSQDVIYQIFEENCDKDLKALGEDYVKENICPKVADFWYKSSQNISHKENIKNILMLVKEMEGIANV